MSRAKSLRINCPQAKGSPPGSPPESPPVSAAYGVSSGQKASEEHPRTLQC